MRPPSLLGRRDEVTAAAARAPSATSRSDRQPNVSRRPFRLTKRKTIARRSATATGLLVRLQRPDPDIAEPDGVAMILKPDRPLRVRGSVGRVQLVRRRAPEGPRRMHGDAVVHDRDSRGLLELFTAEPRRGEDDVVALPLARTA